MRPLIVTLLCALALAGMARAEETVVISAGALVAPRGSTFLSDLPRPALALTIIEPHVLTPLTGADLSLAFVADLEPQHGQTSEMDPPWWYQMSRTRDQWLATSQAVRFFAALLPGLEIGAGLGLHEIAPIESPPGWRGDRHSVGIEKFYFQWRRHFFARLDLNPRGRHGLLLEVEHQRAFRPANYYDEPVSGYVFKLGYRLPA